MCILVGVCVREYSPLMPINTLAYTHHPHLSYTLKTGHVARVFVRLLGLTSTSRFHPQVVPQHGQCELTGTYYSYKIPEKNLAHLNKHDVMMSTGAKSPTERKQNDGVMGGLG